MLLFLVGFFIFVESSKQAGLSAGFGLASDWRKADPTAAMVYGLGICQLALILAVGAFLLERFPRRE